MARNIGPDSHTSSYTVATITKQDIAAFNRLLEEKGVGGIIAEAR